MLELSDAATPGTLQQWHDICNISRVMPHPQSRCLDAPQRSQLHRLESDHAAPATIRTESDIGRPVRLELYIIYTSSRLDIITQLLASYSFCRASSSAPSPLFSTCLTSVSKHLLLSFMMSYFSLAKVTSPGGRMPARLHAPWIVRYRPYT